MNKKTFLNFNTASIVFVAIFFFLSTPILCGQTTVTRIHTDWKGYWTSNASTAAGNRPDLQNNLLGFTWNGTTYSTGVSDNVLTSNNVAYSPQKYKALPIQSLSGAYFLQGSMIDSNLANRVLTPSLSSNNSIQTALASRLTDGINGLALGTGVANITASGSVSFKIGRDNLNVDKLNDGIPDLLVTQVAAPDGGADSYKLVDINGNLVGNVLNIDFISIPIIGSYSLDIFNASNGTPTASFVPGEVRDIRILGIETKSFGINSSNAALVDRLVVSFSGRSDCAFIAINNTSLKTTGLSLVKKATLINGNGTIGGKIQYTFEVKNTGQVPIDNVIISDTLPGIEITSTQGSTLAVGATVTLNGTYTITSEDITEGSITNSAKVTGIDPQSNTVMDISGHTYSDDIPTVTYLLKAPTGITGITTISNGDSTTLTVNGGSAGPGVIPEWFENNCDGVPINTGSNSITVYPTTNTTYYVRYKGTGSYIGTTSCISQLVTVNPLNTITLSSAVGTDKQTIYINTPITPITYTTTGATNATVTGLTPGLTSSFNSNTVTITGTPTTPNPVTYYIVLTGGAGNVSINGTINVLCKPIPGIIKIIETPSTNPPVTNYAFQFSDSGTTRLTVCNQTVFPNTFYSATATLNEGTVLYVNGTLTVPLTSENLWYKNQANATSYKVDSSGKIVLISSCSSSGGPGSGYAYQFSNPGRPSSSNACGQNTFTQTFYAATNTSILGLGTQLYTDSSLETPVGSGNSWRKLADSGVAYRIDDSGQIAEAFNCNSGSSDPGYAFELSQGAGSSEFACSLNNYSQTYYAATTTLELGTQLYYNSSLTTTAQSDNSWYKLANSGVAYRINNIGQIVEVSNCSNQPTKTTYSFRAVHPLGHTGRDYIRYIDVNGNELEYEFTRYEGTLGPCEEIIVRSLLYKTGVYNCNTAED